MELAKQKTDINTYYNMTNLSVTTTFLFSLHFNLLKQKMNCNNESWVEYA